MPSVFGLLPMGDHFAGVMFMGYKHSMDSR